MYVHEKQKFRVSYFNDGMHDVASRVLEFEAALPELPTAVKEFNVPNCCWEVQDNRGEVIAYALCKHKGRRRLA